MDGSRIWRALGLYHTNVGNRENTLCCMATGMVLCALGMLRRKAMMILCFCRKGTSCRKFRMVSEEDKDVDAGRWDAAYRTMFVRGQKICTNEITTVNAAFFYEFNVNQQAQLHQNE